MSRAAQFRPKKSRLTCNNASNIRDKSVRVHWSNKALTQLASIVSKLDEYSPAAAERLGNSLVYSTLLF